MRNNFSFPDAAIFNKLSNAEKINILLTAASFAPSTVNTQPWLFSVKAGSVELFVNASRKLPISDPTGRQCYISLGACWANLELIADSYGLKFQTEQLPFLNDSQPIARMDFKDLTSIRDDLATRVAIMTRHTNRFPFDKKVLPETFLAQINQIHSPACTLRVLADDETKNKITPVVLESIFEVFSKKDWSKELSKWIKPSLKKYEDGMPGYYLGVPFPVSFLMPWALRYGSVAGKQLKSHKKMLGWVAAYGVITAKDNSPPTWFGIGRLFERLAVEAEKNNIKIGILTAPTEIAAACQKLKEILNSQEIPQMFFRLGYAEKVPIFSPRLPITKIIKST